MRNQDPPEESSNPVVHDEAGYGDYARRGHSFPQQAVDTGSIFRERGAFKELLETANRVVGCAGKKVWDETRQKMVYRDCGECVWCRTETFVRALEPRT